MNELSLKIYGGLGEVGMNSMLLTFQDHKVLIDCGLMYSNQPHWGFDVVLPDYSDLRNTKINTLLITHAHEDHLGGLPYLLRDVEVEKIFCTQFSHELIKQKLNQYEYSQTKIEIMDYLDFVEDGPFTYRFMKNTHSIVESSMIEIQSPLGNILHSGDFKIDHKNYADENFSDTTIQNMKSPLLFLSDSTNAEKPGWSRSESEVYGALKSLVESNQSKQIFITFFASNLHRLKMLWDISRDLERPLVLVGRSLWKFFDMAIRTGYLHTGNDRPLYPEEVEGIENAIYACTGSQGDYNASIGKILRDEYSYVKMQKGDIFIHSALKIPGNELNIRYMLNQISMKEVQIIHDPAVHASGHAYSEEQAWMLEKLQPQYFVPIHGDDIMLRNHLQTMHRVCKSSEGIILKDGDTLVVKENGYELLQPSEPPRKRGARGKYTFYLDAKEFKDRKKMARNGLLICFAHLDGQRLLAPPTLDFVGYEVARSDLETLAKDVELAIQSAKISKDQIESFLKKQAMNYLGWKPNVRLYLDA